MSAAETIEAAPSELRPVPGPSPIAGGGRRFFDLLWVMAVTDFKLTFHGTALGYAWSLVRPLLVFGVLLAVFTQVFRFGDQVQDYPALLLLNVMLFSLFSDATQRAVISVVERERIVRRTQFPRLVIPLAIVLTEIFNLALNLLAVLVFILVYGVEPTWTWLLLPVIVAALVAITIAVSMIVSALFPRFRDVALIWSVLSTVLFYATPILYPIERRPPAVQGHPPAQPADTGLRAGPEVDHRPRRTRGAGRHQRLRVPARRLVRRLRRRLRGRGLGLQPGVAQDRRGALSRPGQRQHPGQRPSAQWRRNGAASSTLARPVSAPELRGIVGQTTLVSSGLRAQA